MTRRYIDDEHGLIKRPPHEWRRVLRKSGERYQASGLDKYVSVTECKLCGMRSDWYGAGELCNADVLTRPVETSTRDYRRKRE